MSEPELDGVYNNEDCAKKIISLYPHWIYCKKTLFMLDERTGVWSSKINLQKGLLQSLEKHLYIIKTKTDGTKYLSLKSYGGFDSKQNAVLATIKKWRK